MTSQQRPGLPADLLAELDRVAVPARSLPVSPVSAAHVRERGWRLEDLWLPAVVLREEALTHNLERFARWCAANGVQHAPHGKTTMAPRLWSAQLAGGAWGIACANVAQARVLRSCGVPRVLIANEVLDPPQLRWLAATLADDGFEPLCLVDSVEAVELMERHLAGASRPLSVLVELGVAGGRTGARDRDAALALADRVRASSWLRLAGIEGYEGVFPQRRDGSSPRDARAWLEGLTELAAAADARGLFDHLDEILVTAGGSAFPDLAADAFRAMPELSLPTRRVIRSGCYLTHDDVFYAGNSPLRSSVDDDPLRPALSCFARVISCPEPGVALLGVGKRDVAFDIDLPVPRAIYRAGARTAGGGGITVTKLNDHHGFCAADAGLLSVGDVVELGLSHPCTVFDKWQLIPVLDETDRVVDAVRTIF